MTRRGFLSSVAALAAAPFAPLPKPKRALMFHRHAFALVMAPLEDFSVMRFRPVYAVGDTITIRTPKRFRVHVAPCAPPHRRTA